MTTRRTGKAGRPKLVAVIASQTDLRDALATRQLPDLFELRLDALSPITNPDEKNISRLRAPLIITARHPREGGVGNLTVEKRRELLLRFLPRAEYIDVELQSIREFKSLLSEAKKRSVRLILSYHNLKATPSSRSLCARTKRAKLLRADIFKVATRTDTPAALAQLIDFLTNNRIVLPISAMGIGKLGAISRLLLARCGSALNYASLGKPNVEGQLPLGVLRSGVGEGRLYGRSR
jgi:3-dehydroquinate dehydratase I